MSEQPLLAERPDERRVFHRLVPILRGHHWLIGAAALTSVLSAAAVMGGVALIGWATDAVVDRDRAGLLWAVGCYLAVAGVALLTGLAGQYLVVAAGEAAVKDLREKAFAGLAHAPLRFVETHRAGDLLRRTTGEIAALSGFVGATLPEVVSGALVLLATVVVLSFYSLPLTLVFVALLAIAVAVLGRAFLRRAGPTFAGLAQAEAEVSATFSESLPAREQLLVMDAVDRRVERLHDDGDRLLAARVRQLHTLRWLTALGPAGGLTLVLLLVLVWIGAEAGWIGVSGAVVFVLSARRAFGSVVELVSSIGELRAARTHLARVLDLLDATRAPEPTSSGPLPAGRTLACRGLGFSYDGHTRVVDDVTLRFAPGERVALVGETGSGKTTLGKLLVGLYAPNAGRVDYDDVDLATRSEDDVRHALVLVPQEVHLVGGSIAENLAMAPGVPDGEPGRARMREVAATMGLDRWLAGLPQGLDSPVGEGGTRLSAGERQLVALLRVGLLDPSVLVLDEATADVDTVTAARVEDALAGWGRQRIVIVVAHRPDTVARADRVVRLAGGRVVS